ncbi:MAG: pentapeptide repeat-containing protein, partial [Parvularculaceae bacterium]|nr:pentapeptide repeat-containing protein [Parvularculaceae bacterium]
MAGIFKLIPLMAAGKDAKDAGKPAAPAPSGPTREEQIATSYLDAADEASKLVRTLFYFYLTAMLVVALVVGATTDRGLLFDEAVKLPFYDAGISLRGFYFVAPILFFAFHFNLLVKLGQLRGRLHGYLDKVRDAAGPAKDENRTRRRAAEDEFRAKIYPFDFSVLVAGPRGFSLSRLLVAVIFALTVFVAPLLLLVGVQMRFLAYQDATITLAHQALVVLDALALLVFALGFRWRLPRDIPAMATSFVSVALLALGAAVASVFVFRLDRDAYRLPAPLAGVCKPFERVPPSGDLQRRDNIAYKAQRRDYDAAEAVYERNFADANCKARLAEAAPSVLAPVAVRTPGAVDKALAPALKPLSQWAARLADRISPFQSLDLSGETLEGAKLDGRNLNGASFLNANAEGASFQEANLVGA